MSQRDRSWHVVGSKQVLALVSQDDEQGAPVFWKTKRGRKLRLENQTRLGQAPSPAQRQTQGGKLASATTKAEDGASRAVKRGRRPRGRECSRPLGRRREPLRQVALPCVGIPGGCPQK